MTEKSTKDGIKPVIITADSRESRSGIALKLQGIGVKADFYHAKLAPAGRADQRRLSHRAGRRCRAQGCD